MKLTFKPTDFEQSRLYFLIWVQRLRSPVEERILLPD